MSSRDYFLGRRIAVIGLGPHGEMMADIKFLVKANALVSVYDLRSEGRLQSHLPALRTFGLANQVLGQIPAEDLVDMDLVILSHEYPRDSLFLSEARKAGVQIEYPETLFLKLAPPVTVIGVMGAVGKATVVSMLAPLMEEVCEREGKQECAVIDPESEEGTLVHLKKLKNGDTVIMRIVPIMMNEISELRWSPQVAVFTTVPAVTPSKAKALEILGHQTYNNYVIGDDHIIDAVRASGFHSKAKMLRTKAAIVPEEWLRGSPYLHDRENAALAFETARIFKVSDEVAQDVLSKWKPLRGRLEMVKKVKGVEFYNDSASVVPLSTVTGLSLLSKDRNVVLIIGGADHGVECRELYAAIGQYAHTVIILPGSGTLRERREIEKLEGVKVISVPSIEEGVRSAMDHAQKGNRVLFSPGFDARGIDNSRRERGERFVRAVRAL